MSALLLLRDIYKKELRSIILYSDNTLKINYREMNNSFYSLILFLKNNFLYQGRTLVDLWAVDYGRGNYRFLVLYKLQSIRFNYQIYVKVRLKLKDFLLSVVDIFPSANWLEREVWDMYGIFVENHKDLRRILTDYGFVGYPLRKDFPLSGFLEVFYVDEKKRIVTKPVTVLQEFRFFDYLSPWKRD